MKLKITESKIRQTVNEELLKQGLRKSFKGQKWPTYTAYLGAELLRLEWDQKLQENNNLDQQPSPEWIAETANAFGLSEAEIAEATEIMNNEELDEGVGGFLKAIAKPYQNIWQTFTNITQHAANLTDPEAKQAAGTLDKIDDQLPSAQELPQQMAQAAKESPQELGAMIKELIALLRAADSKVDLDDVKPGLEQGVDDAQAELEAAAEELPAAGGEEGAGGEEAGGAGGEAFVYKGKGGKGLQSFLARGSKQAPRLKGKAMGAVLKHIEKQLKAQGVTVNESILDEVQGWMWYGLVESAMQKHYNAPITLKQILEGAAARGEYGSTKKGDLLSKLNAHLDSLQTAEEVEQFKATAEQGQDPRGEAKFNDGGAKKVRNYYTKHGGVQKIEDKLASLGGEPEEEPAAEEPAAEEPEDGRDYCAEPRPDGSMPKFNRMTGEPCAGEEEPAAEEPAAEEAPIEEVPPTVQNTAPEGAPKIKVFRGKGGEGLQSALAKNRDALGIDQQTVAVIIKSVEQWAQANQIQVENVTAETFDAIINEVVPKFRARKLRETINKLKNV